MAEIPRPTGEIKTGQDHLRRVLYSRARKGHLGLLARDLNEHNLGVTVASLEAFLSGASLAVPILQQLAKLCGDNVEYDPETDLLKRRKVEPIPGGTPLPPFDPATSPYTYRPPAQPQRGPRVILPKSEVLPPRRKPGWAE